MRKYIILEADSANSLVKQVNELLNLPAEPDSWAWRTHGPMHAITMYSQNLYAGRQGKNTVHHINYLQPMTREKP